MPALFWYSNVARSYFVITSIVCSSIFVFEEYFSPSASPKYSKHSIIFQLPFLKISCVLRLPSGFIFSVGMTPYMPMLLNDWVSSSESSLHSLLESSSGSPYNMRFIVVIFGFPLIVRFMSFAKILSPTIKKSPLGWLALLLLKTAVPPTPQSPPEKLDAICISCGTSFM